MAIFLRKNHFSLLLFFCALYTGLMVSCKSKKVVTTTTTNQQHQPTDTSTNSTEHKEPAITPMPKLKVQFLMPIGDIDANYNTEQSISTPTQQALSYIEGFTLALDSLGNSNQAWHLKSINTLRDSLLLYSQLQLNETYDCDLLIAQLANPFQQAMLKAVGTQKCHVISLSQPTNNANNIFYCFPTNASLIKSAADYIATAHPHDHVVCVFRDKNIREKDLVASFHKNINAGNDKIKISDLAYDAKRKDSLLLLASQYKHTALLVASSDEAFVTDILQVCTEAHLEDSVRIYGMPTWENFESLDAQKLSQFHTTIFVNQFINYDNPSVTALRKSYMSRYFTEPGYYAYLGFYFAQALIDLTHKYGTDYWKHINDIDSPLHPDYFKAKAIGGTFAFSNDKAFILQFKDFSYKLINK